MPALHPEFIRVDHPLQDNESFQWKEFKMTAYDFPGQTLYHGGLLVERGGERVFFTGDSIGFFGLDDYCSYNRCFLGPGVGYEKCLKLLIDLKPTMLMAAHYGPGWVSEEYLQSGLQKLHEREEVAARLFPWDNPNVALDPYWIYAYPYRQTVLPGTRLTLEARIMNHSTRAKTALVELRLPNGWKSEPGGSVTIPPGRERRIRLHAVAPLHPRRARDVLALVVTFDGRYLGEFAEALVDYLD